MVGPNLPFGALACGLVLGPLLSRPQCMVIVIKSDQEEARKCYENSLKTKRGVFRVCERPSSTEATPKSVEASFAEATPREVQAI